METNQNYRNYGSIVDYRVPGIITIFIEKLLIKSKINFKNILIHNIYEEIDLPLPLNIKKYYLFNPVMLYTKGDLDRDSNIKGPEEKEIINYEIIPFGNDDIESMDEITEDLDLVLALPPWSRKVSKPISVKLRNQFVNYLLGPYDYGYQLLLKSLTKLKPDGLGIYVFPVNLFYSAIGKKVFQSLKILGFTIDAVFELPKSSFYPYTSTNTNLIIVKYGKSDETFVGSLTISDSQQEILIENYLAKRDGKSIGLGKNVLISEFTSVTQLIENEEINKLYEGYPYPLITIKELAIDIVLLNEENKEKSSQKINSIFLPKIGTSKAVNRIEEIEIKPQNIFQIILDENKIDSQYLTLFMNTELGFKIRKNLSAGSFIPAISKTNLERATIPLPPINVQNKLTSFTLDINNSKIQLEQLINSIWTNPGNINELIKNYKKITSVQKSENWIENLPFPLSSILKGHFSTTDITRKYEFLLFFFEALSEFLVIIKLSGLSSDRVFYNKIRNEIFNNNEKFAEWYKRADFGGWNNTSFKLSKALRSLFDNGKEKEMLLQFFDGPTQDFINMILDKNIINILSEVSRYRNNWKGHGGIADEEEVNKRIYTLTNLLNEIKERLIAGFYEFKLITPISMELSDGIYNVRIKELKGSNTTFQESYLKTSSALEKLRLYFTFKEFGIPVKLLPLIKIAPSPKTSINACYFYNRIDKDGFRYVSYHFDKDAEIIDKDYHINEALLLLEKG